MPPQSPRGLLHSPFLVWKSDLFLSNKSSENNDALAVWFMSTLTAQIAGVNLWHGISRSQAALFVLRHVGGRSRAGKGRGAKKGKSSRFNPSTSNVTHDLERSSWRHRWIITNARIWRTGCKNVLWRAETSVDQRQLIGFTNPLALLSPFYLQWIKIMFGLLQGAGTTETSAGGKSQQWSIMGWLRLTRWIHLLKKQKHVKKIYEAGFPARFRRHRRHGALYVGSSTN